MNPLLLFDDELVNISTFENTTKASYSDTLPYTFKTQVSHNGVADHNYISLHPVNVTFKHTFMNVRAPYNKLHCVLEGTAYAVNVVITIPEGQYTVDELVVELNKKTNDSSNQDETHPPLVEFTVNHTTKKIGVRIPGRTLYQNTLTGVTFHRNADTTDLYDMIGFGGEKIFVPNSDGNPGAIVTGNEFFDLRGPCWFYLSMTMGHSHIYSSNTAHEHTSGVKRELDRNCILHIPANDCFGGVINWTTTDLHTNCIQATDNQGGNGATLNSEVTFTLYDNKKRILKLDNQTDLSITFKKFVANK
jgi:hypothetical protein